MDTINLTEAKLNLESIYSQVLTNYTGAVSLFVGTTRDNFEGKKVLRLEYEAFVPMAEKELKKLCEGLRSKWNLKHIAIHHRLGVVPVGEASVILAISSEHRAESLEAVRYGIDHLKKSVPIWKKEIYEEGSEEWKSNKECPWTKNNESDPGCDQKQKRVTDGEADYVQIKASNAELEKRISAFMTRKRGESDVANVQEFCHRLPLNDAEDSCARTEAILVSRKDSKGHFKVSRVTNAWGPQTHVESGTQSSNSSIKPTPAVIERLQNMEKHLGLAISNQPVSQDVYSRLKALEDRILHLESTSPEYFDGVYRLQNHREEEEYMNKLDGRIEDLRNKLKST